jgi:hypothetical protein
MASDVIERTAQTGSQIGAGWGVSGSVITGSEPLLQPLPAALAIRERALAPIANRQNGLVGRHVWSAYERGREENIVHIANPESDPLPEC